MKIKTYFKCYFLTDLIVAAVIFGLIAVSTAVFAEDGTDELTRRERVLERFDRNNDGELGAREKKHAINVHERLDRNDDGRVSRKEWKYGKKLHNRADRNNDGHVGKGERRAARNALQRQNQD